MEVNHQNQDQNNNSEVQSHSSERNVDVNLFFGTNKHFAFVYKKTEKLATALHMVTNFIDDNEPLKWKIRESATSLISVIIDWNTVSLGERRNLIREYQALALEIVSLSGIAFNSGLISEMNFRVISREFNSLISALENDENKQANEETVILDPAFFDMPSTELPKAEKNNVFVSTGKPQKHDSTPRISKGHSSRTSVPAIDIPSVSSKPEYFPIKEVEAKAAKMADSKDNRQASILKLLSKKNGLNIKDFAESIKGCSEKTIQRELLSMVASGVIKKEGERRWSTYSLA